VSNNDNKNKYVITYFDNDNLDEVKTYFVSGLPLKTKWGLLKPIKLKDYVVERQKVSILSSDSWQIKKIIKKEIKCQERFQHIEMQLDEMSYLSCIQSNVYGLRKLYDDLLKLFIYDYEENKTIYKITNQDEFDDLRKLILEYNAIPYKKKSQNSEIEKFNLMKEWMDRKKNGTIDFDSIYTSVAKEFGLKPHDINDLTLLQFFRYFKRIEIFKNYETSTLFKTVDSKDQIKIINWYQSVYDEIENEKVYNSIEELKSVNVFTNGR